MLLPLLALAVFDFAGGAPVDLCKALSEKCKQPVVATVMSDTAAQLYLEYEKKSELFPQVAKRFELRSTSEEAPVFQPSVMPFFFGLQPGDYSPRLDPYHEAFPDKTTDIVKIASKKDGDVETRMVTCTPSKEEYIALSSLSKCKFGKPISVHWFVGRYRATAYVKEVPAKDFLNLLARTSMGKLIETEKLYRIELDPAQFRKLYIDWAQSKMAHPREYENREVVRARWTLAIEAIKVMTDEEILKLMKEEDSRITIKANRTQQLQMVVNDYYRIVSEDTLSILRRQLKDGEENVYENAVKDIDFSRPGEVELGAMGGCGVMYWRQSEKTAGVMI